MRRIFTILLLLLPCVLKAQSDSITYIPDSSSLGNKDEYRYYIDLKRKPNALKAVWLGAILPGAGQIYNGSYWKLPIVYGGLMGCGFAISLNQGRYQEYKTAYRDLYNDIQKGQVSSDSKKSYIKILPEGYTIERMGGQSDYMGKLKNWQSTYQRYRDLSIVATIAVYALTLIDAYVDAQLYDFDISPDLSMQIEPQIHYDAMTDPTAEVKLAIQF